MLAGVIQEIDVNEAITSIKSYLLQLQNQICQRIAIEDGQATFLEDEWQHQEGGGGLTRVLEGGSLIEKAGVNFSHVKGSQLPKAATAKRESLAGARFQALGVSTVVHPRHPYIPTSHLNVRFIVVEKENQSPVWWFGGGFDLTPYYGFEEDCIYWHRMAKAACEPFGSQVYPTYKKWCDDYFYIKHRQEPRGIGGIFFDDLNQWGFLPCFSFMQRVGQHYIDAYQAIIAKRKTHAYGERERQFQLYRRGRYVEFNLLYDRGTLFGLQSNGRTESILMSLPPLIAWHYNWQPDSDTEEAALYRNFLQQKDWA